MFSPDGANAVALRPAAKTPDIERGWLKDATYPGAGDGTVITATLLNQIIANLRQFVEGLGGNLSVASDTMLLDAALGKFAPKASPIFTGQPVAPTPEPGSNDTRIATTAFVRQCLDELLDGAPTALDTLGELALALQGDEDFAANITNALSGKLNLSGGTMTGALLLAADPEDALGAATKQYVDALLATKAGLVQTDVWSWTVPGPSNGDIPLIENLPFGATVKSITTKAGAGTCTVTGKINGVALGGSANSVSTSRDVQAHATANAMMAGDNFSLTIGSNSNCLDLIVTAEIERSLA